MQYIAWVDTETAGLEPDKHPMMQLAVVITDENLNEVSRYSSYCDWSQLPIYEESQNTELLHICKGALNVNKINVSKLATSCSEKSVVMVLKALLSAVPGEIAFGAYNAQFDRKVLQAAAKRAGTTLAFTDGPVVDPLPIARTRLRHLPKHKLIDVAKHFSLPFDPDTLHDALNDVLLTIEVAKRLCVLPIQSSSMLKSSLNQTNVLR